MVYIKFIFIVILVLFTLCGGGGSDNSSSVNDDSNADTSNANSSTGSSSFAKKVLVFDISILATSGVSDAKILHAANVMAEYFDNDNDGVIDNSLVLDAMKTENVYLFMVASESEVEGLELPEEAGQILFENETRPSGSSNEGFDESLEEILHLIKANGFAKAYPAVFGESSSQLTDAMDIARGGKFTTIPTSYPDGAWYTYDDTTCDYNCMATEYIYWSLTSILGAQGYTGRLEEIQNEWTLNTAAKVQSTDPAIYS